MGSLFSKPSAPAPPPPPPPVPREAKATTYGEETGEEMRAGSSYMASFLSPEDRRKKDQTLGAPGGGASFLG